MIPLACHPSFSRHCLLPGLRGSRRDFEIQHVETDQEAQHPNCFSKTTRSQLPALHVKQDARIRLDSPCHHFPSTPAKCRNSCRNTKVFQMTLLATDWATNPTWGVLTGEKYCTVSGCQFSLSSPCNGHRPDALELFGYGSRSRIVVARRPVLQFRTLGFRDLPKCR